MSSFIGRPATTLAVLLMVGAAQATPWSPPISLVDAHGRLAVGNRLHVTGHIGGNLVHRSSLDAGATWTAPTTISPATGNFPMQYGGLYAAGDAVYLLTAAAHMGPSSQHLDFRKSTDNGMSWSSPIRITGSGQQIRRANIVVSGDSIHVFGGQSGTGGYGTGLFYFRSTNGGLNWDPGKPLYANADASARLAADGTTLHVAFGDKLAANSFGGRTSYMRSADNGATWSAPVTIGEEGRQARQQIVAADGQVFAIWQREALNQGDPLPADRLGYNRSLDGGLTWLGPELLPRDSGVNREHQQTWLTPSGGLHLSWSHGDPGNAASSNGYMFSPDYGATWLDREIAFDTASSGNLPHNIIADDNWVHILAEPGAGTYVRRQVILSGDFDGNRVVDGGDLTVWRAGFGVAGSATSLQGDADADQDVDGADFLIWQRRLGSRAPASTVAVPEPAAWTLLIVGAIALMRRRSV
ncbi:MAG: exo-alpha-sialidase [Pirellulales bacterium]|nr:exo-alpha-sialidase [Pirellulales bacterium]